MLLTTIIVLTLVVVWQGFYIAKMKHKETYIELSNKKFTLMPGESKTIFLKQEETK